MKKIILGVTLLFVSGCLPSEQPNIIEVSGQAEIEIEPDLFLVSARLASFNQSRQSALKDVADSYKRVREELPTLEGLEAIAITTSAASVQPVYDENCQENRYDDLCPIIAYVSAIELSVEGKPATQAGSALSFLAELGAVEVSFEEFRSTNIQQAQHDAVGAAVRDATKKAELISKAAGHSIVAVKRVQSGTEFDKYFFNMNNDTIIVTGSRINRASIALEIEPQPIVVQAEVVAAFEIE